jgi:5-methyltetrahydropteroyltriglutamate--homocysteine methyltransferase
MQINKEHPYPPDVSFDGGDMDCGNGLLLLIRKHIDPMQRGQLLEILSTEISVDEDLPAWCRLTANELVSFTKTGKQRSFLICKGRLEERRKTEEPTSPLASTAAPVATSVPAAAPVARKPAPLIPRLAVTGIGSWPRPRWMTQAVHAFMEGRLDEKTFHETADDAVRLAFAAQERAGVGIVTDGEQRRDSYASFVATASTTASSSRLLTCCPWSTIRRSSNGNCARSMCLPPMCAIQRSLDASRAASRPPADRRTRAHTASTSV